MPITYLPEALSGENTDEALRERLARVRYVFTDLDGTMMGPGSTVLANAAGEPSCAFVETLIALKQAGIEVIPCSGRNRSMLHEDSRVLGLTSYIGEMGGIIMIDRPHDTWEYFTAEMDYDPACGLTPHEVIEQTGLCDQFISRWPGLIEFHNDMSNGYKHREVTIGLRGEVPDEEAIALLDASGMALDWGDNGFLNYISAPTTLHLPEGVRGRAFNIMPKGLGKGRAIERFCELRGIDRAETLAIGDSSSDFLMADAVAQFIMVENALSDPHADALLEKHPETVVARGRIVDGWVNAMRCLLEAQGEADVMDDRCVSPLAYDNRPIGVFDSGLGGLTVARSIATSLSHESIYYVGDTKRCPYGPRSENEVRTFALQAGRWLEAHDVKIIVIACNTATAAALTVAQQTLDVPVIGVIAPGARAAINTTRTRKVGVLATELTVRSGAYTRAIQSLDAGVDVYGCPAPSFVNIVERELATGAHLQERWLEDGDIFDTPEIRFEVARTLSPIADTEVDTVVLGCTHFPLLAGPIRYALGTSVRVVSSAEETTRELKDILHRRGQLAAADVEPQHRFATTSDNIAEFAAAGSFIFGQPLKSIVHVDLGELEEMYRR